MKKEQLSLGSSSTPSTPPLPINSFDSRVLLLFKIKVYFSWIVNKKHEKKSQLISVHLFLIDRY